MICFHDWFPVKVNKSSTEWICRRCGEWKELERGIKPKGLILK